MEVSNEQGHDVVWVAAFISMVGAVCMGLIAAIGNNGCRCGCNYSNNKPLCLLSCEHDIDKKGTCNNSVMELV